MKQGIQDVEHGGEIGTVRPEISGGTLQEFLGMACLSEHRKGRFNDHALMPSAFWTQLDMGGKARLVAEAQVSQGNGLLIEGRRQRIKRLVRLVHGLPEPLHDLTAAGQQPPQRRPIIQRPLSRPFCPLAQRYGLPGWETTTQSDSCPLL